MKRAGRRGRFRALSLPAVAILVIGSFAGVSPLVGVSSAGEPDPAMVRFLATGAGMDPLGFVVVPQPPTLSSFVRQPAAAILLGKALFWDMQVGSDGQACASCHFHAGGDNRAKNQLQPGSNGGDGAFGNNPFNGFTDFPGFGPNYTLTANDFPFHLLSDTTNTNSVVLRDTNDVVSSQGVFHANLLGFDPLRMHDTGSPLPDPVFQVGGVNTRRVEPRNAPTIINSVFNFANFWDGRANFFFNGVNPFGPLDETSRIYENNAGVIVPQTLRMPFASLASLATGPPLSEFEMSFAGRSLPDVGRKLIPRQPLAYQKVHPQDSVLGLLSRATLNPDGTVSGNPGLNTTYRSLIETAFFPKYWDGTQPINGYTQMEANFSLFFGLAVQMYEATLISSDSPFDRFMDGADHALTSRQLSGLELFLGKGGCAACHLGPEFTDASVAFAAVDASQPGFATATIDLMLMQDQDVSLYDAPFHNNGVRPSAEDLGRGGTAPFLNPLTGQPYPLSVSRLALLKAQDLLPPGVADFVPILDPLIPLNIRVAANGEFKTPGLRNVELTGPYFHNGGQATLGQVVEFYDRACDFLDLNIPDADPLLSIGFTPEEENDLVAFMLGLTDERVRLERGPFDHPQLFVPDGHPGNRDLITCIDNQAPFQACDSLLEIAAVGIDGRQAAGLGPLPTFLGIEHLPLHVGISESFPTPQPAGTPITFTATPVGGSGSYEFQFLMNGAVVRPYSSTASWNWNTAGLPDNRYIVGVQARNAGSTTTEATYEMAFVLGVPPATGVTVTPSPVSPQPRGTYVIFTAAAAGPSGSFEYQFLLAPPVSGLTLMRPYSPTAVWVWDTAGRPAGTYTVTVQARTIGSNAASEATASIPYTLTPSGATGAALLAIPSGSTTTGGTVTFTGTAGGGTGPYEYEFQARVAGGSWVMAQPYTPTNAWAWNTTGSPAGGYEVRVNVRTAGGVTVEATAAIPYTLTPSGAGSASLGANPADNTASGNSVTYTATAGGGSGPYEYQFQARVAGGPWVVAQPYTPTNAWTWNTIGSPPGGYEVRVNVRTAGGSAAEATATIPYVLTSTSASIPPDSVSLGSNPADNTATGNSVTYTAAVTGGTGPYEYEFQARVAGGTWVMAQPYTPINAWTWNTIGSPPGGYEVRVNVRTAGGSAAEATAAIPYNLN